jgi:Zn-dependent protease
MELGLAVTWYIVLLVSLSCHEAAHGFVGMKLGDSTAYRQGLVTLDPLVHIRRDPLGTVIVPIVSYLIAGWMIGWASTPYDPYWARQNRRKSALMSLAGPVSNLILIVIAGLVIHIGMAAGVFEAPETITFEQVTAGVSPGFANSAAVLVSIFFSLNLLLFVFNLIPVPPLDGSGVLMMFLSDRDAERYSDFMNQGGFQIMGLIFAWYVLDLIFSPINTLALNILYPGAGYH